MVVRKVDMPRRTRHVGDKTGKKMNRQPRTDDFGGPWLLIIAFMLGLAVGYGMGVILNA